MLPASLFMVHDAIRRCQNQMPKLARRKNVAGQLLDASQADVETWRDHAAFVDAANEVDHHLARAMVVNDLQVTDVSMLLHDLQKFDDDFGIWFNKDLPLA